MAGLQYLASHKDVSIFCRIDFTNFPKQERNCTLPDTETIMGLK
jgi:hypothetical protein